MEEILHQLTGSLSHCLQGFIHPRSCKISSINSMSSFLCMCRTAHVFFPHHLVARLKARGWNGQNFPYTERCLEHSSQKSAEALWKLMKSPRSPAQNIPWKNSGWKIGGWKTILSFLGPGLFWRASALSFREGIPSQSLTWPLKSYLPNRKVVFQPFITFQGRAVKLGDGIHTLSEEKNRRHHTWSKRLLQHLLQQMQRQLPVKAPQQNGPKKISTRSTERRNLAVKENRKSLTAWNLYVLYFGASTLQKKALSNQNRGHLHSWNIEIHQFFIPFLYGWNSPSTNQLTITHEIITVQIPIRFLLDQVTYSIGLKLKNKTDFPKIPDFKKKIAPPRERKKTLPHSEFPQRTCFDGRAIIFQALRFALHFSDVLRTSRIGGKGRSYRFPFGETF